MSKSSDMFNALPVETRKILVTQMIAAEIRFVTLEKQRIVSDARKAMTAHNNRIHAMQKHLDSLEREL